LTNTGPFIEDENEPDFRRRIALRYIDWRALRLKGVSASGTTVFSFLFLTLQLTEIWVQLNILSAACSTQTQQLE
jgi:hypothetical protein